MFPTREHCVKAVAIITVVVAVVGTAGVLHAGMIVPGTYAGSGPGGFGFGSVTATPTLNNDNATVPAVVTNLVSLAMTFTALGPIDFGFAVVPSSGTTEYFYGDLTVNNVTGVTWTDFHFELRAAPPDLDFDAPDQDPTPTSTVAFTTLNHQATTIDWSGGLVPNGASAFFTFTIDVPDLPTGTGGFILRNLPTVTAVPEPSSLVLLGSGIAGLGALRRYRNRGQRARLSTPDHEFVPSRRIFARIA